MRNPKNEILATPEDRAILARLKWRAAYRLSRADFRDSGIMCLNAHHREALRPAQRVRRAHLQMFGESL